MVECLRIASESFDVVGHVGPGGVPRTVDPSADPFGFQRRKEAFPGGVVPYVSGTTQRTVDAIVGDQPLELLTRILPAAVGVPQQGIRPLLAPPDRH